MAEAYLHGGFLRDKMMGFFTNDIDLMISDFIIDDFIDSIRDFLGFPEIKEYQLEEYPKMNSVYY